MSWRIRWPNIFPIRFYFFFNKILFSCTILYTSLVFLSIHLNSSIPSFLFYFDGIALWTLNFCLNVSPPNSESEQIIVLRTFVFTFTVRLAKESKTDKSNIIGSNIVIFNTVKLSSICSEYLSYSQTYIVNIMEVLQSNKHNSNYFIILTATYRNREGNSHK